MNVDGDFRYVDHGAFDEAEDFMEYCNMHGDDWEAAFIEWIKVCEEWKARRKVTSNGWTNWNLLKVMIKFYLFSLFMHWECKVPCQVYANFLHFFFNIYWIGKELYIAGLI